MKFRLVEDWDRLVEARKIAYKKFIYEIRFELDKNKSKVKEYFTDDFKTFINELVPLYAELKEKFKNISWKAWVLQLEVEDNVIMFPACQETTGSIIDLDKIIKQISDSFSPYIKSYALNRWRDVDLIDVWNKHHANERIPKSHLKLNDRVVEIIK